MTFHRMALLPALVLLSFTVPSTGQPKMKLYTEGKHNQGELKYINQIPVLIVAGSPKEMGEQAGALTAGPIKHLLTLADKFKKQFGVDKVWPVLAPLCRGMTKQFPPNHLEELEAFVKKNGMDRDLAIIAQVIGDAKHLGGCSTLVVGPTRSLNGPLFGRNTDLPSVGVLDKYVLVTVYKPRGKRSFAVVGYPGLLGATVGMNDAGLALTINDSYSSKDDAPRFNVRGVPTGFLYRRVLAECATVAEAEKLVRATQRAGLHIATLCDPKHSAILEVTTKTVVVCLMKDGIIARTNHFRSDELCTDKNCRRYNIMEKCLDNKKFTLSDVHKQMDAVNQGPFTVQTVIFEPRSRTLHLAFGDTPASKLPLRTLQLDALFKE
ncbi:MAG TPA: C45 family peptidase [Gemmataceae bacterium]|nr:C45 family peptidase [Gemmataceae bacterium]